MRDTIDMAREAGFVLGEPWREALVKRFADLVRADERDRAMRENAYVQAEREACAELVFNSPPSDEYESPLKAVYDAIRARGNT
jgi:hypothetical protein